MDKLNTAFAMAGTVQRAALFAGATDAAYPLFLVFASVHNVEAGKPVGWSWLKEPGMCLPTGIDESSRSEGGIMAMQLA